MTTSRDNADTLEAFHAQNRAIEAAMQDAVNEAVLLHKRLGLPMVEWIDGKIVWTPAEKLALGSIPARTEGV